MRLIRKTALRQRSPDLWGGLDKPPTFSLPGEGMGVMKFSIEMSRVWVVDCLCLIACVFVGMGRGLVMSDGSCLQGYGSWIAYV